MDRLVWIAGAIGVAMALFALDRLGLWLESCGWVYYRRTKPSGGAAGNALMQNVFVDLASFADPSAKNLLVLKEERKNEQHAGDPPEAGEFKRLFDEEFGTRTEPSDED